LKSNNTANLKIRDISHHDENLDFAALKSQGYDGVIIKATQGVDYIDPALDTNVKGAKAAGLHIGFYHYFSFKTDINEQIKDFLEAIAPYSFDYLPTLDVEIDKTNNATVPPDIMAKAKQFLNAVKVAKGGAMQYANPSFIDGYYDDTVSDYPLWIAHYGVPEPADVKHFSNWIGWQHQENPDLNVFTSSVLAVQTPTTPVQAPTPAPVIVTPPAPKPAGDPYTLVVQQKINRLRITSLTTDGIFGPITRSAVTKFEQIAGIGQDGAWGPQCEAAYQAIVSKPLIKQGSTGVAVRYLQYRFGLKIDGIFGVLTLSAAKTFQSSNGLAVDGLFGNLSWTKLIG